MLNAHRYIEALWWSQQTPPLPLCWASRIYARLNAHNLAQRLARQVASPVPLISIGNITAGGSGKTPFVLWLADALAAEGLKPVLLCRGDGGKVRAPLHVQGEPAALIGDEARLLADSGHPLVAAKDRVAGAQLAATLGEIILLDDGLQYRQLGRSLEIVLVPAAGVGNGHPIPAGPLREPVDALARADLIVRTGGSHEPAAPLGFGREWQWRSMAGPLQQIAGPASAPPTRVLAACAIARPERFLASLAELGIAVAAAQLFPDHHRFSASEIAALTNQPLPVAITAKDAVKLLPHWPNHCPLWLLPLVAAPEQGLLDAIRQPILSQLKKHSQS